MKLISAIIVCLSVCGCASTQIVNTLPWDRTEVAGYYFTIIAKEQTETFRFKPNGSAITTIYNHIQPTICAPILPWFIDDSGVITIITKPDNITLKRVVRKNGSVEILRNGKPAQFKIMKLRY